MANVKFKNARQTKTIKLPSYNYYKTEEGEIIEDINNLKEGQKLVKDKDLNPIIYNDTEIIIYKELKVGENEELAEAAQTTTNDYSLFLVALIKSIKDWNFTTEDDKKLDITIENLRKFNSSDLNAIMVWLTGKTLEQLAEEQGKKK